jgi:hypothetical protein
MFFMPPRKKDAMMVLQKKQKKQNILPLGNSEEEWNHLLLYGLNMTVVAT